MQIDKLRLQNFRNYEDETFCFHPLCNVIYGDNAQGKTNLLEAIAYLSCGRSPRARSEKELLRFEGDGAKVSGSIGSRQREFQVEIGFGRAMRRKISINKVPAKKTSELAAVLSTVYFCPDDLMLIREGAAARRRFLDEALRQLLPRYEEALLEYNRLYEHKTRILRDSEEKPSLLQLLPEFNEGMARAGALLIHYRARYCEKLATFAAQVHSECSGGKEALSVCYETVSTVDPFASPQEIYLHLIEHQRSHEKAELASRLCLSGPHKDDLVISINGSLAKSFGSQGQTRTAALALKLAEREIMGETIGEMPVLLLDDVLSELDPRRQEFVLSRIGGGQVFITCCEDDRLGTMLTGKVFHISNGHSLSR
ncbi:MAG: DNA replication/repair protein RecF [Oscillospiraceae bacterium]|nr:DNA replication/repair protein RecF [Oscillospiraceae bacterium]